MQINPRYDSDPIVVLDVDPTSIVEPLVRQRRRMVTTLADLTDDQWTTPSRCDDWTVRDVASHLDSTNGFWSLSMAGALAGEPTRVLVGFDPKATPAALADADAATSPADTLARFAESTEAFCVATEQLTAGQLTTIGEAPPGHVPLFAVLHHALWDAWIHERDMLLPLDLDAATEPDEVLACLRYAAALQPAIALTVLEETRRGRLAFDVTDPDATVLVEVDGRVTVSDRPVPAGVPTITGTAVDLVEGLSVRAPLKVDVPEDERWLLQGLAEVFEET